MKETQTLTFSPKFLHVTAELQYIQLWIPTLFTFYVVTVISKNITTKAYADRTVLKKIKSDHDGVKEEED